MTDETEDEYVDPLNAEPDSPGAYSRDPDFLSMCSQAQYVNESHRMHDGSNILFTHAQHGDSRLLDYLKPLAEGMLNNVGEYRGYDGSTPLWWAARNGHRTSVEILLHGAPEHFTYGPGGVTPLMIASMYGHDEVVQLLCQRLPLNDVDLGGNTAVHYAARYGEEAVLKQLVGVGADCTVQNYCGETPEQLAREAGFDNCVVMLQDFRMFYPLWAAVGMGDVADLEKGGKLAKDTEHPVTSETLLHWAARRPDVAMLRYLLDQGLPAKRADKWNCTPLSYAVARGNVPAVKLLLSTGSVEANSDVTLKALALYGENSEMHELLFAHAERSQRQTEKAQMRFNIMWQMRTKTPAEYPLYVQLLKQNGYSLAEIDELLVDSSNMEMEDLEKLADHERLVWSGADQNEEFSGSEEMQDCLGSLEEEDLLMAALKRDSNKTAIPDELATSEGAKEETDAEKKRRKKAKKAKMKERQRSKQQGAEGKDRDEEGEEDDAEADAEEGAEEKGGAQKDDEAAAGATAGAPAKKKKKNKKKKNTAAAAEDGADLEAELSRDDPLYHEEYQGMFNDDPVDDVDVRQKKMAEAREVQRMVEAWQVDEALMAAAEDSSVGPPPAGARAQIAGWSMDEGLYMNTGHLQDVEQLFGRAVYNDSEGDEPTADKVFKRDDTQILRVLMEAKKRDEERKREATERDQQRRRATKRDLLRQIAIETDPERRLALLALLRHWEEQELPRPRDSWYGDARATKPNTAGYGRRDDDDSDSPQRKVRPPPYHRDSPGYEKRPAYRGTYQWAEGDKAMINKAREHAFLDGLESKKTIQSLIEEHRQRKRQESGQTESRAAQSAVPQTHRVPIFDTNEDTDDLGMSDDIDESDDDGETDSRGEWSSEDEAGPSAASGNNEAERLAEKRAEKNRKKKERRRKAKAMQQGNREQDEEALDSDDVAEREPRSALLGGGGGMFGWRGLLSR